MFENILQKLGLRQKVTPAVLNGQTPQEFMDSRGLIAPVSAERMFPEETYKFNREVDEADLRDANEAVYTKPKNITSYGLQHRNPQVKGWLDNLLAGRYADTNQHRLKMDEIISGIKKGSKQYNVPEDLLADTMGLESMMGYYDRPIDNFPGQYADEKHARGPMMFLANTIKGVGFDPEDRYSATASALAAAEKISRGQLGEWDVTDKPGAGGGKLTDWYSEGELAPYSSKSNKRRSMLQEIAAKL